MLTEFKSLDQIRELVKKTPMYSSYHIRKCKVSKKFNWYIGERSYPSYDRPDWYDIMYLTDEQKDSILEAGILDYWFADKPK
jgi:hypothetical protein